MSFQLALEILCKYWLLRWQPFSIKAFFFFLIEKVECWWQFIAACDHHAQIGFHIIMSHVQVSCTAYNVSDQKDQIQKYLFSIRNIECVGQAKLLSFHFTQKKKIIIIK